MLSFFRAPAVILVSWGIFIVGMLGALHLIGAKLPAEGTMSGLGDLFRNA